MKRAEGKVALITGAARAQGRSHAVRLAQEGADIIALDICGQIDTVNYPLATAADLAETVTEVETLGRRILAFEVDVRDFDAMQGAVASAAADLGRLDIVCANAGISGAGPADELTEREWTNMIDTNLTGVWHTAKASIPHLKAGGRGGSIVLTSSVAGLASMPNLSHYAAAKHGVIGLMRTLAVELAGDMIRVNALCPTQVETPMIMNDALFRLFVPGDPDPSVDQVAAVSQSMNALPIPWVQPSDISNAVAFLVSDEARYVTGVALPIDAGLGVKK